MQPIERDKDGVIRFKANSIVVHLYESYRPGMNRLVTLPFSREDFEQFYQLIGYSVSGYGDLGVSKESIEAADKIAENLE